MKETSLSLSTHFSYDHDYLIDFHLQAWTFISSVMNNIFLK